MSRDYALALGQDGTPELHRADCRAVRALAAAGEPVLTLLSCEREPDDDIPRHDCLES